MAQHVLLLRGINLGATNRISMPDLRDILVGAATARNWATVEKLLELAEAP